MSAAQSWNVRGIDPKVREAAREAAERRGMSLGEYLNHTLANHAPAPLQRARSTRFVSNPLNDEGEAYELEFNSANTPPRSADPARLAQRVESIERRMQLAVTGLDRAVSTIDRSVLGLAARLEDAESLSSENAERVAEALEHFRIAGETLGGKLERTERDVRERLETQVGLADDIARRADAAVAALSSEIERRHGDVARSLEDARATAELAAKQAADASADAVAELRALQMQMSDRLAESETSTRRAVETALHQARAEAEIAVSGAREALSEQFGRIESEVASRAGAVDQLKSEHAALIARIERAEAGARESTAGLRQAAGAAIADLRNAQLSLAARVKQVEDAGQSADAAHLTDLRQAQQDVAERLAALESKSDASPVAEALAAFERRLAGVEDHAPGAISALDQALHRLGERISETEGAANSAIRTLENTVSSLGARLEQSSETAAEQTESVRALLEERLSQMVGDARTELSGQLQAAIAGSEGVDDALADVNRRLAAAERRQAQTIEAISIEIRRMSETVDKRLRAVEARNDDAAASAVREELERMSATLAERFDEIEHREAAAFDRMSLEVGKLSERLEDRVGAVEARSAQAIEHVGEQVARMAERFTQRQETMSRELGERMLDSEERAGARVSEAISSIMQRLAEVEQQSADAIAPVHKAVSSVASKLDRFESARQAEPILEETPRSVDASGFGAPEPQASPMSAAQPLRAGPLAPTIAAADIHDALNDDSELDIYFQTQETQRQPSSAPFAHDDDLVIEDNDAPSEAATTAAADAEPFWKEREAYSAPTAPAYDDLGPPPMLDRDGQLPSLQALPPRPQFSPHAPTGKNDYLANARKAAIANATPPERQPTPRLSLRGSSRVIIWGAATTVAAVSALGAWYMNNSLGPAPTVASQPQAANPAPADASAPTEPGTIPEAGPVDPLADTLASATEEPAIVAGPLAPRNVSLEQAAEGGDLTAQYELALQRLAAGRAQEGVALLRRAADRGFAMAQYRMAKLHERGEGVPVDLSAARQWTERAAAAGNRRAMHDLGVYFARGEGAPLDEAAAFRWFRQAAELGVADSQYNLGILYQQGRGVNASASEALFWFLVAARHGDGDAGARATALEAQLPPTQVQQAQARAQAFRPRASNAVANGEFTPRQARNGA